MGCVSDARGVELAEKIGEYPSFVARLESRQREVDFVEFLEIVEILRLYPCDTLETGSTR